MTFGLIFPLKQPYRITSPYGPRWGRLHNGIDIAVPIGTPIYSPMSGTVSAVYYNEIGGNQMIVKHPNGITTGYSHLSKQINKKGDSVKVGDIIGLTGNTGRSTGPHLHFTTRKNGERVDPQSLYFRPNTDISLKIRKFGPSTALIGGLSLIALTIGIYHYQKKQ